MATTVVQKLEMLEICFTRKQIADYLGVTPEFIADVEEYKCAWPAEKLEQLNEFYLFCNF